MSTEVEASPEADTAPPSSAPQPVTPSAAPRRRWRWPKLGIQSKLLLMLLATSIVSCVVVGVVGYRSGRDALREAAFEQLTFVRNSRARGMVREYTRLENQLAIFTRGKTAIEAIDAFHEGFHELEDSELTAEQDADLQAYYDDVFVANLNEAQSQDVLAPAFYPHGPVTAIPAGALHGPLRRLRRGTRGAERRRRQRVVRISRGIPPVLQRPRRAVRLRGRPARRRREQRRVHGVQRRRPGHQPGERAVRPDEPGRRRGGGARVELRRPRGDHRPRALPAVVRRARRRGQCR